MVSASGRKTVLGCSQVTGRDRDSSHWNSSSYSNGENDGILSIHFVILEETGNI
jgi:hypothetical protein